MSATLLLIADPLSTKSSDLQFALSEHEEYMNMKRKNTICLWFDKDAHEAARFYAAHLPG